MATLYLNDLTELVKKDSSHIKEFIHDLPGLINEKVLLFSKLDLEATEKYCFLLNQIIKRISISARRSKVAFTSLWDNLKVCFEILLNDALYMENGHRIPEMNILLRNILQLGIVPSKFDYKCKCVWLAMDLDTQLKWNCFTIDFDLSKLDLSDNNSLNQRTFYLYCDQFYFERFYETFRRIKCPSDDLTSLFFSVKYFSSTALSQYITDNELNSSFIFKLGSLNDSEWLKMSLKSILKLTKDIGQFIVSKAPKEQVLMFEVLVNVAHVLDLRFEEDFNELSSLLSSIVYEIEYESLIDSVLSKYWAFVSSLLSCDCVTLENSLESRILYTLQSNILKSSKIAVCRVLSVYWSNILETDRIFDLLFLAICDDRSSDKLKWNVAVALMNFGDVNNDQFDRVKEFLSVEMKKMTNFKVIYSYTKLLLKWTLDNLDFNFKNDQSFCDTIWISLSKLKIYINENEDSLECAEDDGDEEKLVENARKLDNLLKSILIGGEDDFL